MSMIRGCVFVLDAHVYSCFRRTFRLELVELTRRLTTDVLEGAQNLLLEGQTQSRYPAFVLGNRL